MGNIIRIISAKSQWISDDEMNLISTEKDVSLSSLAEVNINGEKNGRKIGVYNFTKNESNDEKDFPTAYWSYDFDGLKRVPSDSNHSFRTTLEKTVYFQINPIDSFPTNVSINFQLWEKDAVNFTDDNEFNDQEVFRWGTTREIDGKKRITIELFLENIWKKEIANDRGAFQNGCIELFWKWEYKGINWNSRDVELSVYPSDNQLRLKPALDSKEYALPEVYSHKGDIVLFAIDRLPNSEIQKFVSIKIRKTITFTSVEGVNKFKKEIYSEAIDVSRNRIESTSYQVEDVEHFFTVKEDIKKIFVEEEIMKVPVARGSDIAVYNSIKKGIKFGKQAAEVFGNIQVLDEMRNMIPELSSNGKFNKPSLSTFVGFIPGAQIIAFGVGVLEWIAQDQIREMNEWIDNQMWITWQNVKTQGIDAAKSFKRTYWAMDNGFDYIDIDQSTLNSLLKGKFKKKDELLTESFKNSSNTPQYTVFIYRVIEEEIEDYFDVVDCIFIKK